MALGVLEYYRAATSAKKRSLDERVYPGRRFDVLGLTRPRARRRVADRERSAGGELPGLGIFSAWLGGLPGWLSGMLTSPWLPCNRTMQLHNGLLMR